jgi:hypothetical protein
VGFTLTGGSSSAGDVAYGNRFGGFQVNVLSPTEPVRLSGITAIGNQGWRGDGRDVAVPRRAAQAAARSGALDGSTQLPPNAATRRGKRFPR